MRLGNKEFEIKRIDQYHVAAGMYGTCLDVVGNETPDWSGAFMPITDTGKAELDNQLVYIGDANRDKGVVSMRLVLKDSIPLISTE